MSWRCSRRGLTLVEVVAALGLLAALLTTSLAAFSRNARQLERSRLRLEAIEWTEAMLLAWRQEAADIPFPARGELPGRADLVWQTTLEDTSHRGQLPIDVVRLEVRAAGDAVGTAPLVSLELFAQYAPPEALSPPTPSDGTGG